MAKRKVLVFVYFLISLPIMVFYIDMCLYLNNYEMTPILLPILLIVSFFIVELLFKFIFKKDSILLRKTDKNNIVLSILICISELGLFNCLKYDDNDYLIISYIAFSILIGAFIPLTEILDQKKSSKEKFLNVINQFVYANKRIRENIILLIINIVFIQLFIFFPSDLLNNISIGSFIATLLIILITVIYNKYSGLD